MSVETSSIADAAPIPITRTIAVELRKMVDTRAGRWMLIVIAALSLLVVAGILIWGDPDDASAAAFLNGTSLILVILLPIIGIMAATSEWTQRTGLVTFTLEPRRGHVIAGKLVASVLLGLGVVAIAIIAAIVGHLLATALRGSTTGFDWTAGDLIGTIVGLIVYVVLGAAIGLAVLNTPAAIVISLLIPNLFPLLHVWLASAEDAISWFDLPSNVDAMTHGTLDGSGWAKLLVSVLVWIGIPLAIGIRRVTHGEVK